MRRSSRVGLPAVAVAVLLGCGEDLGPRVPAAIAVTPEAPQVLIDGTLQLEAAVVDASGRPIDGHTFVFTSSDTATLKVGEDGLLTAARHAGTSRITVESGDLVATVDAEVVLPPSTLIVNPRSLDLDTGEQGAIDFLVTEKNGKPLPAAEVAFSSSDPSVVQVQLEVEGLNAVRVTGLAVGSATVTLTSGELRAEVPVTVGRIPGSLEVTPRDLAIPPGGSHQATAVLLDRTGDPLEPAAPITWSSSDEGVVTVSSSGLVTSVGAEGTAVITATTDTFSTTMRVFVGTVPAGERLAQVELSSAMGLALAPDGQYFVGGFGTFARGALPDFALPVSLSLNQGRVSNIVLNADLTRAYLIVTGFSNRVVIMDLTTNTQVGTIEVGLGSAWAGALSADGSVLTVGTTEGLERFDLATRRSLGGITVGDVYQITRHPSKPLLYVSGGAGVLEIDDKSGAIVRRLRGGVSGHVVTPDGKRLYTVSFRGIGVWNLETGAEEPTIETTQGQDVALSPDARFLYVVFATNHHVGGSRVEIVDPGSGTVVRTVFLDGWPNRIAVSPDGTAIITNEGGAVGWVDFIR